MLILHETYDHWSVAVLTVTVHSSFVPTFDFFKKICCFLHWIQSVNPHFYVTLYYNGSPYIHNLYRENISPSLKKILLQLKEKMNFPYGKTHLWRLLKKMGFGYEKRGRQRIISERSEIIAWRERYLRRIRKIREADPERAIVYTDETWLNQGHRTKKEWADLETLKEKNLRFLRLSGLTVGCTKEMTGKGQKTNY